MRMEKPVPDLPPWEDRHLDTPLRQLAFDLPGRTLRELLFDRGLAQYLVYEHPYGKAALQAAVDHTIDEILAGTGDTMTDEGEKNE